MTTRSDWNSYKMFEGINIWGTPEFAGAAVGALDLSGLVPGTELDGSLIKAGTESSQIEFSTAEQFGLKFYLKSNVTSGNFTGLKLRAEQAGIGGNMIGAEISSIVSALTPGSGHIWGMKCGAWVDDGDLAAPARDVIGASIYTGSGAGSTIGGTVIGLDIRDNHQATIGENHYIVHISADGTIVPEAAIAFKQNTDFVFLFYQTGVPKAVSHTGDKSGGANDGWIKVSVEGNERFVQLYQ